MRVGIVVPSYYSNFEDWSSRMHQQIDSLKYLKSIDNLVFLINWQNIPSDERVKSLIEFYEDLVISTNPTWEYKCLYVDKYNPVSMCRIRNDCMNLDTTCDLYMFVDDDLYFREGSADIYKFVIDSFSEDSELGMVMCASFLGGYNYIKKLRYDPCKYYMTNRGLFFRNLRKYPQSPIYPDSVMQNHIGGYEDAIVAIEILRENLKLATAFNCPTYHPNVTKIESTESNSTEDKIHDVNTSQASLEEYILDEFNIDVSITGAKDLRKAMRKVYESLQ